VVAVRRCLEKHGVPPVHGRDVFPTGGAFPTLASRIDNPKFAAVMKNCGADSLHAADAGGRG
jgi:hypothetical protein